MITPRRPVPSQKRTIIDIEPEPAKPKMLKPAQTKQVDILRKGVKDREVAMPISKNKEIQDGDMLNGLKPNLMKASPHDSGFATVGLGIGATLNMGDYQSARVDCFIIRNVPDNDESISDAMQDISQKLNIEVKRQGAFLTEES